MICDKQLKLINNVQRQQAKRKKSDSNEVFTTNETDETIT